MKILYIYISASINGSSVQTKIINQIKYLNEAGAECKGIFFSTDFNERKIVLNQIEQIPVKKTKIKYFSTHFQRRIYDREVKNYINSESNNYDIIYYRYPGASFGLCRLTKQCENLFFEINGNLPLTIKKNKIKTKLNVSSILHNLNFYYIPLFKENFFGKRIFNNCKAIVSVSNELHKIIFDYYNLTNKNVIVLGNGIAVDDFKIKKVTNLNEFDPIVFILLKGASTEADYLGFDRFIKGIAEYKGKRNLKVFIAGKKFENEMKLISDFKLTNIFEFFGYVDKSKIDELIDTANIAIGTLATYRSGINEISSLKTREYFSRGIPFLIGYKDTDLDGNVEAEKYFLKVPNNNTPIKIESLISFFTEVIQDNSHSSKMNKIAFELLDFSSKMKYLHKELKKYV